MAHCRPREAIVDYRVLCCGSRDGLLCIVECRTGPIMDSLNGIYWSLQWALLTSTGDTMYNGRC
eukprot:1957651-Lingulodinium_polyedra.AAC.1